MAILSPQEIFFTTFEPVQKNRFVLYMDGIPTYMIKGVSGLGITQDEIVLNHINVLRKVKGKTKWNDVTLTLHDPITPSGVQATIEWIRLGHESITGRNGYSDFYKKDLTMNVIGPVGDIVREFIIKGAFPKSAEFGDFNYDTESEANNLTMTLAVDYIIINY